MTTARETKRFARRLERAGLVVTPKRHTRTGYVVRTPAGVIVGSFGTFCGEPTRERICKNARAHGFPVPT